MPSLSPLPLRRIFFLLAALALLVLAALGLSQLLIKPDDYRAMIVAKLEQATGATVLLRGASAMRTLPSPVLTLQDLELTFPTRAGETAPAILRIATLQAEIPFSRLLSGAPQPERIILLEPSVSLQSKGLQPLLAGWAALAGSAFAPLAETLRIQGGTVTFIGPDGSEIERIEAIKLFFAPGANGTFDATGRVLWHRSPVLFEARGEAGSEGAATPLSWRVWRTDANSVRFTGTRARTPEGWALTGDVKASLDLQPFAALLSPETVAPPPAEAPAPVPQPAEFSGKLQASPHSLRIEALEVQAEKSAGKGTLSLTWTGTVPEISLSMAFSRLEVQPGWLLKLLAIPVERDTPLPIDSLLFTTDITAETLSTGAHEFPGVTFKAQVAQGQVHIETLSTQLPGESSLTVAGDVLRTPRGLRFQGTMETGGKNLRAVLAGLEPSAAQLPESAFGEFFTRANLFISADQLRISEAEMKIGALNLGGGLVTYFESQPRVEADIMLTSTNLDYFRDAWREEQKTTPGQEFIFKLNSSADFSWLRNLATIIDLKLHLNGFTFLDRSGTQGEFRIYARAGEFRLDNIDLRYPDGTLTGSVKLNVAAETPQLEVALVAPVFNSSYLSPDGDDYGELWVHPKPGQNKRWSETLFDFDWMRGVGGTFDVTFNRFTHHGNNYGTLAFQGELQNEQLQIKKLAFERFGGKVEMLGTLTGGKVPGLNASFTLYNADIAPLLAVVSENKTLAGRVSLSGTLITSGIHFLSWLQQGDIKTVIAARGVVAQGLNLQGVIDAVNAARSVADVSTNVKRILPTGQTEFAVDGNINIRGGVMRTPGLTLTSGRAVANLTGELDLLKWKMALNMLFQLPMLQSETVPTLTVDLEGTPDKYDMSFDSTSLEAFVAKRIVGR